MSSSDDVSKILLDAARAAYDKRGYLGTTIKGVAAAAGVAPDVAMRYYRNREQLFAAAMRLPFDPATAVPEMIAPGLDGMGDRLVSLMLTLMGDEQVRGDLRRVLNSSGAANLSMSAARTVLPVDDQVVVEQIRLMSEYLSSTVLDRVVAAVGVPDARMRVAVISSYLVGIATTRYILRLEPLASATDDEVVSMVGPAVQALLDPTRRPGTS